jgi:hypothetical protein
MSENVWCAKQSSGNDYLLLQGNTESLGFAAGLLRARTLKPDKDNRRSQ